MPSNDKNSPRIDEQLDHDTQSLTHGAPVDSRAREDLQREPTLESEWADPSARPDLENRAGVPDQMEIDLRSAVAASIAGAEFPAARSELVEQAAENSATDDIIEMLRDLPEGEEFQTTQEVWDAIKS